MKKLYILLTATAMTMTSTVPTHATAKPAAVSKSPLIGVWETERKEDEKFTAHVKIAPCQGNAANICGHIVSLEQPNDPETGKPKLDKHNLDEAKQKQPVLGMQMMWHFQPANETLTKHTGGEIYSAGTGQSYSGDVELKDPNTLALTGYVLMFSKTQTWKRVKG
jgi:uncharacterized protein (DUF2147 family)